MLFQLDYKANGKYRYVYKDQSFIKYEKRICEKCRREIASKIFASPPLHKFILDGGKKYPDLLQFCGAGGPFLILSQMALQLLLKGNVTGITSWETVQVCNIKGENEMQAPQYCIVKLDGEIELDYKKMFLKRKNVYN